MAFADHRIHFPIAESGATLDHGGAVLDGDPVEKVAPTTVRAHTTSGGGADTASAGKACLGLPCCYKNFGKSILIRTDVGPLAHAQPATDLFRTPLFLEQTVNVVPRAGSNAPAAVVAASLA